METSTSVVAAPDSLRASRYDVIDGDIERDRDTVIGLWRGVIGWQDQLDRMYEVFYRRCPFGQPRIKLLRHRASGEIVGTIGVGPRPSVWQGRPHMACVLSHLAVTRAHRSLHPAVKLIRTMTESAAQEYPFGYAMTTPTGVAAARRAGYATPLELCRYVKFLRYRPFAQRALPGRLGALAGGAVDAACAAARQVRAGWHRPRWHAQWSTSVDARMQALWEDSPHGDALATVRSVQMLRWRFLDLPALDRRFLLVGPAPGAPLVAWFVCETSARAAEFMTVTDAWFAAGVQGADRDAIRLLCGQALAAGYAAIEVRLLAASPVRDAWLAEGFAHRGGQPFFLRGIDAGARRADGSLALHITDIEQDG